MKHFANRSMFTSLFFSLSIFFLGLLSTSALSFASPATTPLFEKHADIEGRFHGEIRLQSSDGKTNRLLVPGAEVNLQVTSQELILTSETDLAGKGCHSRIGSVRELYKYASGEFHAVKAIFDFSPGRCFSREKYNSLLVLVDREDDGKLTMETLLLREDMIQNLSQKRLQKMNIHGFLVRTNPAGRVLSSNLNPTPYF